MVFYSSAEHSRVDAVLWMVTVHTVTLQFGEYKATASAACA